MGTCTVGCSNTFCLTTIGLEIIHSLTTTTYQGAANFQNFKFFFNFKNFSKVGKFCLVRKKLYKHLSVTPTTTLVSVDKFDSLSRDVKKVGKGVWWWSGLQINSACCKNMFYFYKFDFESRLLLEILL